ncbi:MAG TPA: TetR/AcrR family transcriptional regulator [Thermodesulfobacteriota bacterium]|nr:TetR/AcrR family transcriptional regulator [Thermodesulfobacteriota bacterium]
MPKMNERLKSKNTINEPSEDLIHAAAKNADLIQKRHQQIVDGACQLFFEKGYHPTTIRDIARACGMSMGQLYHYISSKDDVLYLVHKHMQNIWYEYLKNSDYEEAKEPVQKLLRALRQTLKFMSENRKLIQFIYSESKYLDRRHLQAVLQMDKKNVIGFWDKMLRKVNSKKSIEGDPNFLASLITYLLVFLPLRGWTLRGMSLKQEEVSIINFILKGLGLR